MYHNLYSLMRQADDIRSKKLREAENSFGAIEKFIENMPDVDKRCLALARTKIEESKLWLTQAILNGPRKD